MDRRAFLTGSAVAAAAPFVGAASAGAVAESAPASLSARLQEIAAAARATRMPVEFDGHRFSGRGCDWLLKRGREAGAFLLGEEHGIAENPKLAAQLFSTLRPDRYAHLAVEISPPMAAAVEEALSRGGGAFDRLLTAPDSQIPFFGLLEEADWVRAARAAVPAGKPFLWGLDYDVTADRYLLEQLKARPKPAAAATALKRLADASTASWAQYEATKSPQFIFSFAGNPALVEAVEREWPSPDEQSRIILATLRETLAINQLWVAGKGYESNLRRSRLMRANLLRYWRARRDPEARLFMKMGASHMVRGLSMTDIFDIGSLVPELVAERGGTSFHLLVLPGPGTETANFDPTKFTYIPGKRDEYGAGMDIFDKAILPNTFTLFDTAPLRPMASSFKGDVPLPLWRVIHGFDAVLIMTGSRPSSNI